MLLIQLPGHQAALAQAFGDVAGVELTQLPLIDQFGLRLDASDKKILTAAEMSSNPVTSEMAALRDTVSPDDLLLEPGHHVGREVVVTGSVVWLLRRYWLQLDSGHMSILINVEDLQLDDRNKLKDAVVQIEFLARVRARITGTIERQGSEDYHLAATELVLVK